MESLQNACLPMNAPDSDAFTIDFILIYQSIYNYSSINHYYLLFYLLCISFCNILFYIYIHVLIFLYPMSCNGHVISCVGKDCRDDLYSCRDDAQSLSGARLQIRQVVVMIASIHLYIYLSIHTYICIHHGSNAMHHDTHSV